MVVMPMFPLGSVLLPGGVLPLHVFEPRYQALVRHCMATEPHEFGVVLIERGREVGGGDQRLGVGVAARIVKVAELEAGQFAVLAVGTHRIRVDAWLPDAPYPLAEVTEWPDVADNANDALSSAELIRSIAQRVRRASALALELGDPQRLSTDELSDDPILASYQLAALAPLGPADGYQLLCAPTASARLEALGAMLDDVEPMLQFRLRS